MVKGLGFGNNYAVYYLLVANLLLNMTTSLNQSNLIINNILTMSILTLTNRKERSIIGVNLRSKSVNNLIEHIVLSYNIYICINSIQSET